jgi:hypothetical protein
MPSVHDGTADRESQLATPPHAGSSSTVSEAIGLVRSFVRWLDSFGELSHDPYDLWTTSVGKRAKRLYYEGRLIGTVAVAPFVALDLLAPRARAVVRRRSRFPTSDAHYAMGFFELASASSNTSYVERGRTFLEALDETRSPLFDDPSWGHGFDWPTRYGVYRAEWPLMTSTPYGYEAFEAGYLATGDPAYLAVMRGAATFVADRIPVTEVRPNVEASAYTPYDNRQVVNASAYRGFLLTTAAIRFEREDWLDAGRRNISFVLQSQRQDGSWLYSMDGADDFVDNFHTCFVLKSLAKVWSLTRDEQVRASIDRGYDFYLTQLLDERGLPRPYARRPRLTLHRRDLYDYAEGVNLAHLLQTEIPAAGKVLTRLVHELAARWALPDGHFVTRELVVGRSKIPYHRWAQAQTFHALARVAASGEGLFNIP